MQIPFKNLSKYQVILASKSPRRQFLLKELGLNFEIKTKETEESFPVELNAEKIVMYLCEKKANAFNNEINENNLIITADTIVWINHKVLNKPENTEDAIEMLQLLSGKKHEVYTGICLKAKHKVKCISVKSEVIFKPINISEIKNYIEQCKPFDKAGSYGAQECLPIGMNPCSEEEIRFLKSINKSNLIDASIQKENTVPIIEKIIGSYFNVMGLPVVELYKELQQF